MGNKGTKLLIVGGLPDTLNGYGYGGATVLMQNFVEFLERKQVNYRFVQTNRYFDAKKGSSKTLKNLIVFSFSFLLRIGWTDVVMFNFSDRSTVRLFPLLQRLTVLLGKRVVLRKFGGSLDLYLAKFSASKRNRMFVSLRKCDLILLETKNSIEYMRKKVGNDVSIGWFPNVRANTHLRIDSSHYNKRLVFISHIKDEKGVGDILKLAGRLSDEYEIHLLGPIMESKYRDFNFERYGVKYKGQLKSHQVLEKLMDYDVLLLPSYREGYPGIIIEAMSVGMPVVATNVGGIVEIVENGKNGLLVEPGNVDDLERAVRSITVGNYKKMCEGARAVFENQFESEYTNERILNMVHSL